MDNAFEAWAAAIRYCNDIKDGKATLQYQKNFVMTCQRDGSADNQSEGQ